MRQSRRLLRQTDQLVAALKGQFSDRHVVRRTHLRQDPFGVHGGRVEHSKIDLSLTGALRRGDSRQDFAAGSQLFAQISKLFVECGDGKIRGDNKDARSFFYRFAQMMLVILAERASHIRRKKSAGIDYWPRRFRPAGLCYLSQAIEQCARCWCRPQLFGSMKHF